MLEYSIILNNEIHRNEMRLLTFYKKYISVYHRISKTFNIGNK